MVPFKKREFTVLADLGHEYLSVPYQDVIDAGLETRISRFSYRNKSHAFLEQDNDAPLFLEVLRDKCIEYTLKDKEVDNVLAHLQHLKPTVFRFS
jgi:hypothetical protein